MSEQGSGPQSAAGSVEILSAIQFQEELRRVARFNRPAMLENPLAEAVHRIEQNPAFTQSRLLARMLTALAYQRGDFRRAETASFDSATLGIVIALMNAERAGTTTREEWMHAADAANAAQVKVDG